MSEELLTVEQVAEILGVPPALVVRRMEDGRLPWLRVCRQDDVERAADEKLVSDELLTAEHAAKILGVPTALVVRRMEDGRLPWRRVCRRGDAERLKAAEDEQAAALRDLGREDEVDYLPGPEALHVRGGKRERADITWTRLHIAPPEAEDMRLREILIDEIMARQPAGGLEELSLWQLLHSLVSLDTTVTLTLGTGTTVLAVRSNR